MFRLTTAADEQAVQGAVQPVRRRPGVAEHAARTRPRGAVVQHLPRLLRVAARARLVRPGRRFYQRLAAQVLATLR